MSTVLAPQARPRRLVMAVDDTTSVAGRNLRTLWRTPQALVFATVQPVMFVLLFRYAFGGAIHVPGVPYVDYLMPGIFAQAVAFGAIGTAVGLSTDLRSGILTRFRTLPMSRTAVLGGRTVADLVRNVAVVAVMAGVGFVPLDSMPGWLQAFGAHQPVTALVNAERALILGRPAAADVATSLAWSAGILIVFAALAARTYHQMDH